MKIYNDGTNPVGLYPTREEYSIIELALAHLWGDIRTERIKPGELLVEEVVMAEELYRQVKRDRSI